MYHHTTKFSLPQHTTGKSFDPLDHCQYKVYNIQEFQIVVYNSYSKLSPLRHSLHPLDI